LKLFQNRAILAIGSLICLLPDVEKKSVEETITTFINKVNNTKTDKNFVKECPIYLEALKNSKHPMCMNFMEKFWDLNSKISDSSRLTLTALNYLKTNYKPSDQRLLHKLLAIFYDSEKKYTEEVRIETLSLILDKFMPVINSNDSPILENIFRSLYDDESKPSKEFVHFCQRIIFNQMAKSLEFK
jgi:hypothetical protein